MKSRTKNLWLQLRLLFFRFKKRIVPLSNITLFLMSLASIFLLIVSLGYDLPYSLQRDLIHICTVLLFVFFSVSTVRFAFNYREVIKEKLLFFDVSVYLLLFGSLSSILFFPDEIKLHLPLFKFLSDKWLVYSLLAILSVINISKFIFGLLSSKINSSLLFIYSFLFIILIGTGLLMLPNSCYGRIDFVDALFTATTSVCVTGLCTVDVSTTFTYAGQIIILALIQIGGIGVMTFTSFFALSFMSKSSFDSSVLLKDFLNEENLGNIFRTLVKILIVTFIIEIIGAYLIWDSIQGKMGVHWKEEIFISIFHAISAFCNAGISTLHGNLANHYVVHNYNLHFWISTLIIFGGLGFPIVFNYLKLIRHFISNGFKILTGKQKRYTHQPKIVHVHTWIVVISTSILLISGTLLIYFSEKDRAFAGLSDKGQWVSAFFNAVTPRTAGFNTSDLTHFTQPTLFVMLILMIIGAAPMSTGGGMKVNTVAIAILSAFNTARGKQHLEIASREISAWTVQKAFSVIALYLAWTCIATCALTFTEEGTSILTLLFEVVSALSTVGLSLNFSPDLSLVGKYIIIGSMFIGRIGVLVFLAGLVNRYKQKNYRYPEAGLIIG